MHPLAIFQMSLYSPASLITTVAMSTQLLSNSTAATNLSHSAVVANRNLGFRFPGGYPFSCTSNWDCPYKQSCLDGTCVHDFQPNINDATAMELAVQCFLVFLLSAAILCLPCLCIICAFQLGCCNDDIVGEEKVPPVSRRPEVKVQQLEKMIVSSTLQLQAVSIQSEAIPAVSVNVNTKIEPAKILPNQTAAQKTTPPTLITGSALANTKPI